MHPPHAEDYDRFAEYAKTAHPELDLKFVTEKYPANGFWSTATQMCFATWWAGVCTGRYVPCHKCEKPFRFTPCCPDCGYIPIIKD